MSLIVIGTLAYDTVETSFEKRENVLGGSATHCAVAASRFVKPRLVTVVGNDFKEEHVEALRGCGINLDGLEVADGKTFRWGGRYEPDWNTRHTTFTELNVLGDFDPKLPDSYRDSNFVFLANAVPAIQMKALSQVDKPEFVMADTMNLWIEVARDDLLQLLTRIDAIILNDEEARMLTGENNLIRAASQVLDMGPRYVVLKKGEHGAFIMGKDVHFSLPSYPVVEVLDPTGAGDSFAGGFMGHLAKTGNAKPETLRKAMLYGTVTASFCVQGFGIEQLQTRALADIESRVQELLSIVTL